MKVTTPEVCESSITTDWLDAKSLFDPEYLIAQNYPIYMIRIGRES